MFFLSVGLTIYTNNVLALNAKKVEINQKITNNQEKIKILILGNSLTAGYGLEDINDSFPIRLEKELNRLNYKVKIINAGISGDTTAGGLARLDWSLQDKPDGVIIELGGNDGLRAINPEITYKNLELILSKLNKKKIPTMLTGMRAPPNLGEDYTKRFYEKFEILAFSFNVIFFPFFLEGVAGNIMLNQPDLIHPNSEGVNIIVKNITPYVEKLIKLIKEKNT